LKAKSSKKVTKMKTNSWTALCLVLALAVSAYAADAGCGDGATNELPINTNEPKIFSQVENGYRQKIEGSEFDIIHMYGDYYQMGQAHGQLLKDEIPEFFTEFWNFLGETAWEGIAKSVPIVKILPIQKWFVKTLTQSILPKMLDLQYWLVEDYVPQYYKDEYKGIGEGAGVDPAAVMHFSMIPEIAQMACSMFGAWGPATKDSLNGGMVHIRALAWIVNAPMNKYARVLVYHPEGKDLGHAYTVWAWSGFVGAVTGFSSARMGISEKLHGASVYSRIGKPTTYVMRDVMNFETSVQGAVDTIFQSRRTNSCWLGIGDGKNFEIVQYHHLPPQIYDYANFTVRHAPMDHVMWLHGDNDQNHCYRYYSTKYYGKIEPEVLIRVFIPGNKTGPTHIAVFDYDNMVMYISHASPADASGHAIPAWAQPYTKIDLNAAFSLERPKKAEEDFSFLNFDI